MEFIIDNPETEKTYKRIIRAIPSMQNGITATAMEKRGLKYEKNFGVSIVDLKYFAGQFEKDHLLALKLWNKKWRESMILATLLDSPDAITEEQMDFWIKTSENTEIIEQIIFNLFTQSKFAFIKAIEWCRGKKFLVKYAGLLMMGRMALTSKDDIDEMFESFFDVILPLSKDSTLAEILYRSLCQLARRSNYMHEQCVSFIYSFIETEDKNAIKLGNELLEEINSDDFKLLIKQE